VDVHFVVVVDAARPLDQVYADVVDAIERSIPRDEDQDRR